MRDVHGGARGFTGLGQRESPSLSTFVPGIVVLMDFSWVDLVNLEWYCWVDHDGQAPLETDN